MESHYESGYKSKDQDYVVLAGKDVASRSHPSTKLQHILMSNKPVKLHAELHREVAGNTDVSVSKPSSRQQRCGNKGGTEEDEVLREILKQHSYLEMGKKIQQKPFNVVLDWRHLDKQRNYSPTSKKDNHYLSDGFSSGSRMGHSSSPGHQNRQRSSSHSHLEPFPMENHFQDPCYSGRGRSCSPARQRSYQHVPQSQQHPQENATSAPNCITRQQFFCGTDQTCAGDQSGIKLDAFRREVSKSSTVSEITKQGKVGSSDLASSCNMKPRIRKSESKKEMLQSEPVKRNSAPDRSKEQQILLRLPSEQRQKTLYHRDTVNKVDCSDICSRVPYSCSQPSKDDSNRQSAVKESCAMTAQSSKTSPQQFSSPLKTKNTVDNKLLMGLKSASLIKLSGGSDKRPSSGSATKTRPSSPIRRLSSAVGNMIRNASSRESSPLHRSNSRDSTTKPNLERAATSTSSDELCMDKSHANSRARSSPLRRLFDPLIKSKASNDLEATQPCKKDSSSTVGHWKSSDEQFHNPEGHPVLVIKSVKDSHENLKRGSTSLKALLQVAVRNGLPLLTFAVDDASDILAATPRKLSSPEKICSSWIYTFFTLHETKRNNGLWLNQVIRGNDQSYVSNVVAQMKVSNARFPVNTRQKDTDGVNLREFTLFSVDINRADQDAHELQPANELAAIVVKIHKATKGSPGDEPADLSHRNSTECPQTYGLSATIILPGDVHTIPSKGSISSLTQRWRLGGSCDCGGWDVGCQLRIFTNQCAYDKPASLSKTNIVPHEFKLFRPLGQETQLVLSFTPLKDRTYSVEFDSSISLLQAFAICVAVLDCRRPSWGFIGSYLI